ncbi:MAG: arginine--tRNA ligase [Verrucomicrobia bacterium]|nr:arginine--tRNA ligase [Verrucomicrobiota bacterium]
MSQAVEHSIASAIQTALEALRAEGALVSEGWPPVQLEEPKDEAHGDLSCTIAMRLAKPERKKPRDIAELIVAKLQAGGAAGSVFDSVEIAGPGFINFTLLLGAWHHALREVLARGADYGRSQAGKGKRANVEFVSANPTGPLTVGHGRQAILGDVICRVLAFAGFDVEREYYYNNAGRQMRVLGESLRLRYLEALGERVEFPEDHYRGEYLVDLAREIVDEHGEALREHEADTFQRLAEKRVFAIIETTLKRLAIRFDRFFNEYDLYKSDAVGQVVRTLRSQGDAYDKDGAVWFHAKKYGANDDRVIVKSTGEPTYRLPDVAYHLEKLGRGYDRVIDVLGQDHHSTVQDVRAGLKAMLSSNDRAHEVDRITVLLHQFVTLTRGGQQVKMSTRRAEYVTLDDLLDQIAEEIGEELRKRETVVGELTPERLDTMARDAVRYFYSMRRMESHLEFDLDLAVSQSMQNPVYYLQYAHARICSIFKKWSAWRPETAEQGGDTPADLAALPEGVVERLVEPEEVRIIKLVARFPRLVEQIADSYETHRISEYLHTIARELQGYYEKHRVLGDDADLTLARLALIRAVRTVLSNGLEQLLGISAPETM